MSMLGLAHIGDAVYELLTRTRLCGLGVTKVSELHRMTVATVNAPAQAEAAQRILPKLTEEETGLEALFGWLYLLGRLDRIGELYAAGTGEE